MKSKIGRPVKGGDVIPSLLGFDLSSCTTSVVSNQILLSWQMSHAWTAFILWTVTFSCSHLHWVLTQAHTLHKMAVFSSSPFVCTPSCTCVLLATTLLFYLEQITWTWQFNIEVSQGAKAFIVSMQACIHACMDPCMHAAKRLTIHDRKSSKGIAWVCASRLH